jgi:predicted permease
MAVLLSIFASDILPIFVIAGIGFLLAKFFDTSVKTLSRVVFNALVPCLSFSLLVASRMNQLDFGRMAAFVVLTLVAMGVIARVIAIPLRLERPAMIAFLLTVMLSNGGNYGMPVVMFAFGRDALSHATVYFIVSSATTYTVGVFLASTGRRSIKHALTGIARVPAIYGVAAAALVIATGVTLPLAITRPVDMLGNAALPMMILVLGMQLERATVPDRPGVVATASVLSLVVAPLVALGLVKMLGMTDGARQAAVLQASMPTAVVTTILALEFDLNSSLVTGTVFATTLLSPFTLTALIAYLRQS